jgi:hypothetical protein
MIPLVQSASKNAVQADQAVEKGDELILAGTQLHQNLSQRKIPLTAVVFVIDGSVAAADEVERQIRLQSRGIDRSGRLSSHEIGMWMPSTNVGAAREWLKKFSMNLGRNDVLKGERGTRIRAGCTVADPELAFAAAVESARQNLGPI